MDDLEPIGAALEGLANFLGLGDSFKRAIRSIFGKKNYNPGELQGFVRNMVSEALAKNQVDIDSLNAKLNSMPFNVSTTVKSLVNQYKNKLKNEINQKTFNREIASNYMDQANTRALNAENAGLGREGYAAQEEKAAIELANKAKTQLEGGDYETKL